MALSAPLTKLEAVNLILRDLGDRPVNSLTGSTRSDVAAAIASLEDTSRNLQATGYWFNEEVITVVPNGSGEYTIQDQFIRVDVRSGGPTSGTNGAPSMVVRGSVLYDVVNGASTGFTADIVLNVVRMLEFEDLPQAARAYVYAAASHMAQMRIVGANDTARTLRDQAAVLLSELKSTQIDFEDARAETTPRFRDLMVRR